MSRDRRQFSGHQKVAILKKHLLEQVPVSKLCDEFDLFPTPFYAWLKAFFENGHAAFAGDRKTKTDEQRHAEKIAQLEAKLQRKDTVLAELMEEYVLLKKSLGES